MLPSFPAPVLDSPMVQNAREGSSTSVSDLHCVEIIDELGLIGHCPAGVEMTILEKIPRFMIVAFTKLVVIRVSRIVVYITLCAGMVVILWWVAEIINYRRAEARLLQPSTEKKLINHSGFHGASCPICQEWMKDHGLHNRDELTKPNNGEGRPESPKNSGEVE